MISAFLAGARGWVGYLDTTNAPDILLFESNDASRPTTLDLRNQKTKMQFCFSAAIGPLTHIFPPARVKSYVDGDKTKIQFLDRKRQVDSLRSFFPVDHNNAKFFPEPVHGHKPLLLDLADLLAYAAARGLSKTANKNRDSFISMVNSFDPGYSEVVFNHPDNGGAMYSVRTNDPGDRIKTHINKFI